MQFINITLVQYKFIMDTQVMYQYNTHTNIPWNIVEYSPLKEYLGPKNNKKVQPYATKRGFYMNPMLKVVTPLPPPNKYPVKSIFDQTKNKKESKKHPIMLSASKRTYLDDITKTSRLYKSPGVGQYSVAVVPTKPKKKKKINISDKRYFYQQNEFFGNDRPGSFSYYPHDNVQHVKKDRTDRLFWIAKHKKDGDHFHKKKSVEPAPGTYRPVSVQHGSFDRMQLQFANKNSKTGGKSTSGFCSSDAKFPYDRKTTVRNPQVRPDPSTYQTRIEWQGKKTDAKKKGWVRCLSAGYQHSVYH